jgi:hypothetical protein
VAEHAVDTLAVEDQELLLVLGQELGELVELGVGDVDRGGDVAAVVFAGGRAGVDDRHVFRLGQHGVAGDEGGIDALAVPVVPGGGCRSIGGEGARQRGIGIGTVQGGEQGGEHCGAIRSHGAFPLRMTVTVGKF